MPDKTPTIIAPVAADVQAITLLCTGGVVTSIESSLLVRSTDPATTYRPDPNSGRSVPTDYTQGVQDGLAALVVEAAAKFATNEGF